MTLLPPLRISAGAHLLGPACLYAVHDAADSVYRMAFNGLFLVHVATFSVALFALIFVSATIDVARLLVGSSSFSSCRGVAAS